jgi:hypothetical protein
MVLGIFQTTILANGITNPVLPETLTSLGGAEIISRIISTILTILLIGGAIVSLVYIILGAYGLMTAGGDKSKMQENRERITHAVIALIILFSAFAIINLIGYIFGINLTGLEIPTLGGNGTAASPTAPPGYPPGAE